MRLSPVNFALTLILILGAVSQPASGQKTGMENWLPITPQDLQIKDVPGNINSSAIQLYFSYFKDDNEKFIAVYKKIKILNQAGMKYADIEIEIEPDQSLKSVAARTVHPDGSTVDFQGKPMEKTRFKTRGVKYSAATFTMPEVTVGSIIEVRWTISLPLHVVDQISEWPVQGELFTLRESLRFRPSQNLVLVPSEWGNVAPHSQVSYSYLNQVDASVPQKKQGNVMQLELENVPVFYAEEYMPPHDDYRPAVLFYYGGRETASPDKFWEEWRRIGAEFAEKYIGNFREVREAAEQAVAGETDPDKKLRKLYARAQQVRNLSFERERTEAEAKKEDLKRNSNASDVVRHGYGTSYDVDRFFAAMARAAGFEANLVRVTNRQSRSFTKILLWLGQLDQEAVEVRSGGKTLILDPGTKFCPFGALRWRNSSAQAMRLSRNEDAFFTTPAPEVSRMKRAARMKLSPDGNLQGEITVELNGADALEHRLEALNTDEAGRRKSFENEVQAWLPKGATVKMVDAQGWESAEAPLTARFTAEVPSYASLAGKRLVVPTVLFSSVNDLVFNKSYRRYPITFPYPFAESDDVEIQLPDEYALEEPPYHRKAGLNYAGYEFTGGLQGSQLSLKRDLSLQRAYFEPEQYGELKGFFAIVQAGDESQAVLQSRAASVPEKTN